MRNWRRGLGPVADRQMCWRALRQLSTGDDLCALKQNFFFNKLLCFDTLMFICPSKTSEIVWVTSGEECWLETGLLLKCLTHACTLNCSKTLLSKAETEKNREQADLNSESLTTRPAVERPQHGKLTVGSLKWGDMGSWEMSMDMLTRCPQQSLMHCQTLSMLVRPWTAKYYENIFNFI